VTPEQVWNATVRDWKKPSEPFEAAYNEARHEIATSGECVNVTAYGYRAWGKLTPEQCVASLEVLFANHFTAVQAEERKQLLDATSAEFRYLGDEAEFWLRDALASADINDPEAQVTCGAQDLQNALNELELLRHRLRPAPGD
jgi:hypothetical protein